MIFLVRDPLLRVYIRSSSLLPRVHKKFLLNIHVKNLVKLRNETFQRSKHRKVEISNHIFVHSCNFFRIGFQFHQEQKILDWSKNMIGCFVIWMFVSFIYNRTLLLALLHFISIRFVWHFELLKYIFWDFTVSIQTTTDQFLISIFFWLFQLDSSPLIHRG